MLTLHVYVFIYTYIIYILYINITCNVFKLKKT